MLIKYIVSVYQDIHAHICKYHLHIPCQDVRGEITINLTLVFFYQIFTTAWFKKKLSFFFLIFIYDKILKFIQDFTTQWYLPNNYMNIDIKSHENSTINVKLFLKYIDILGQLFWINSFIFWLYEHFFPRINFILFTQYIISLNMFPSLCP